MCSSHFIENMCELKKISKYYVVITMIEKCTFSVEIKKRLCFIVKYKFSQVKKKSSEKPNKQILLFT